MIGFFSAVLSIDRGIAELREKVDVDIAALRAQDISEVRTEASLIKQRLDQIIDPKIKYLDDFSDKLSKFNERVGGVEIQTSMIQKQYDKFLMVQVTRISNIGN